jgi:hypothetical protein
MNTTFLFVELLIIGFESWVWMTLLFFSRYTLEDFGTALPFLKDWQPLILLVALAFVYVTGVIVDRIADWAFRWLERQHRERIIGDLKEPVSVRRFSLGTQNDFLNQQLDYTRTRLRIVRASALNVPVAAIALGIFVHNRASLPASHETLTRLYWIAIIGFIITAVSIKTLDSLIKAHLTLIRDMVDYQKRMKNKDKGSTNARRFE